MPTIPPSPYKSRPVYSGLSWVVGARRHVIAAEGEGALSALDLLKMADQDRLDRTTLLYTPGGSRPRNHGAELAALLPGNCHEFPSIETLLFRLNVELTRANMSTRLYTTGTEGFMGQVIALAQGHGVNPASVLVEHRGSLARRVQCVHCKGFMDGVTTSLVACGHCHIMLFVRDHYSRRLGAFQGVIVNAEVAEEIPAPEELYP